MALNSPEIAKIARISDIVSIVEEKIGDFFTGCIVKRISGIHANSDNTPWENPPESIMIRTNGQSTRTMMNFCGLLQGKSSEFA